MMVAAEAMKAGLVPLRGELGKSERGSTGKVVLGTVKGDLHDIGKNLVGIMLEGAGFEVVDLGIDVPVSKFISTIHEENPQIVGLSGLLTTTLPMMRETVAELRRSGAAAGVKLIVGGAPVTQSFAEKIGADGYAENASSAVALVKALL
jgi:5-methyltetrahydrofolate--homocysteine methyltransferase